VRLVTAGPRIEGNVFTANHSVNHGGGIHGVTATFIVRDCAFRANEAGSGSGIYLDEASHGVITRCEFRENLAIGQGGGICVEADSYADISDCVFVANESGDGGAICLSSASADIQRCRMEGNTASFGGGLEMIAASSVAVADCEILSNEAYWGGGVYIGSSSGFVVEDVRIADNHALEYGGAAWIGDSGGTILSCEIASNDADLSTGGIKATSSLLSVHDCSIHGNGLAMSVMSVSDPIIEARENWWGHDSGPYHPTLNPSGLGDEVGDRVDFAPWLQLSAVREGPGDTVPGGTGHALEARGPVLAVASPAREGCVIRFALVAPGRVDLRAHDAAGRRVRTLLTDGWCDREDRVLWDGRGDDGRPLPSGAYWLRIEADGLTTVRRVVLLH
jgi:hypothetical protein